MYDNIDFASAIELTKELVRINTYETEGKIVILNLVKNIILKNTDAQVTIYDGDTDGPYLTALLKAENPEFQLLLEGHLDVVSPEGMKDPFEPKEIDGILYGRGTCDMKGGCAALLTAFVEAGKIRNRKGNVYLMFSTDEEYASAEIIKALENNHIPKVDFAMIAEPTYCKICNAHKGNAWMDVVFTGKSAHASSPENGINSIEMAAKFICSLKSYISGEYENQRSDTYGVPTMNVGVIEGGSMPNVVPPYTKIRIDKRYLPGGNVETFRTEIQTIINQCKKDDSSFNAEIASLDDWPSVKVERENIYLQKIQNAIYESVEDAEIDSKLFTGWGEGGFIEPFGIPVVYYGPGELIKAHSPDEFVAIKDIEKVAKGYYSVIRAMCY